MIASRAWLPCFLVPMIALAACGDSDTGSGGASASASSSGQGGMTPAPAFTVADISVASDGYIEAESSVAVAPGGIVAATWIGATKSGGLRVAYSFSTDQGNTWSPPAVASPGEAGFGYGDPTLVTAADGSIYLAFAAFDSGFTKGKVFVARAAPGETTFGAPVLVNASANVGPFDKPVIAVTKNQSIVVAYIDYGTGHVVLGRSADSGATFTRTDPANFGALPTPCADPDTGRVWVTFLSGTGKVSLRWSDDDGVTFPVANSTVVNDTTDKPISTDDPVCVGRGNQVWIAYALSNDTGDSGSFNWKDFSLRIAHSSDGGATIDSRVDAHDPNAATFFMEPALALEAEGAIDIAYYAGNKDADPGGTFRYARSTDAGQTFEASTELAAPVTFVVKRDSPGWLGDYSGFIADGGRVLSTYTDNASGTSHISFLSAPVQ
jgi:hypothetical protein